MEENYQLIDESIQESENLEITRQSKIYLNETRKWAKFLAIILFILAGFMVIVGFITMFTMNNIAKQTSGNDIYSNGSQFFFLIFIAFSSLYIIPAVFLFRFAKHMKVSLYQNDQASLETAFKNLKSHYRFIGILVIVGIAAYFVFMLVTMLRSPYF